MLDNYFKILICKECPNIALDDICNELQNNNLTPGHEEPTNIAHKRKLEKNSTGSFETELREFLLLSMVDKIISNMKINGVNMKYQRYIY